MKRRWWLGFASLCLLSGTSWAIPAASELPPLQGQALLYGVIGLLALALSWRSLHRGNSLRIVGTSASSIAFVGVPMLAAELSRGAVGEITRSALFSMTPVIVVIASAAMDTGERDARRFLVPALAGVGGLLLLLPLALPASAHGQVMLGLLVAAVALEGVSGVWLFRVARQISMGELVIAGGLGNAVFLLACSAWREQMIWRWGGASPAVWIAPLADIAEVMLIFWLVRTMTPIRFASRYLWIPLVTVLESLALERPAVTVRILSGLLFLAAGAGTMLFWRGGEDDDAPVSLR